MSTRSVTFIHKKGVTTPTGDYVCKLYRHCDGYVEGGLGDELVDAFKKYEETGMNDRDIFAVISEINWYEFTEWIHSDAEYVYHIYDPNDNGKIRITYQTGFDEESILKDDEVVLLDMQTNEGEILKKQCEELLDKIKTCRPEKLREISITMKNILDYN